MRGHSDISRLTCKGGFYRMKTPSDHLPPEKNGRGHEANAHTFSQPDIPSSREFKQAETRIAFLLCEICKLLRNIDAKQGVLIRLLRGESFFARGGGRS
jgi:hypothetical protein